MDNLINTYEDEWANVVQGLANSSHFKVIFLYKKKVLKIIVCRPIETKTIQAIR